MTARITIGAVADRYGVSAQRVRQLDRVLQPVRCGCGARLYDAAAVERVAEERLRARAQLREERRARSLAQQAGTYQAKGTGRVKGAAARRRSSP